MTTSWEVSEICTTEAISAKVASMPQPVGIVLFGDDGDFKNEVIKEFFKTLKVRTFRDFYSCATVRDIMAAFERRDNYLVILKDLESRSYDARRQCILMLRTCGAKSVIGVYVSYAKRVKSLDIPKAKEFDLMLTRNASRG